MENVADGGSTKLESGTYTFLIVVVLGWIVVDYELNGSFALLNMYMYTFNNLSPLIVNLFCGAGKDLEGPYI